ncbi:MAG: phenylacetate-CoA oxygenase subunit PaaC [Firmicutes bacterium]|nr:phenylacetate-CoA oxygenase subunit PaaC [Alicyclobacillaceae bacterium]MCL6496342.1 phenylacetate-CoA oxygenase subunit PaaC [Bacillota bacterium]
MADAQSAVSEEKAQAALQELLWQLADDDLLVGFRASEWLGLGVHIEEDIAFASIAQDEVGHAQRYYGLLEGLGLGRADDLAHLRPPESRRNSVLLEWPNGEGQYFEAPRYDWAFTLVRHHLYDVFEIIRLEGLVHSHYSPLAETAAAILGEKAYHRDHQELWIDRLWRQGGEARQRVEAALALAAGLAGDLAETDPWTDLWESSGWWPGARAARDRWHQAVTEFWARYGVTVPPWGCPGNGRAGRHTPHLAQALAVLSEVYRQDPTAGW